MASQHASHDQEGLHPEGGLHPGGWHNPPCILRDMVNERVVRILLECILVVKFFDS